MAQERVRHRFRFYTIDRLVSGARPACRWRAPWREWRNDTGAVAGRESSGGDEPVVRLGAGREAEIIAWGDDEVLRWLYDPDGRARLELEAAAMTAAAQGGVAVPVVHEVVVMDGRPGLVMDRVDGEDLLTMLERRPWTFAQTAARLGRFQAQLHEVGAPPELPELRRTLRERIDAAPHLPASTAAFARDLLARLPDGDRLCHGDFHPGNVIVAAGGDVLIDWSNAARGDPTADLARTMLLVRLGALPAGTPRVHARHHPVRTAAAQSGVDQQLPPGPPGGPERGARLGDRRRRGPTLGRRRRRGRAAPAGPGAAPTPRRVTASAGDRTAPRPGSAGQPRNAARAASAPTAARAR